MRMSKPFRPRYLDERLNSRAEMIADAIVNCLAIIVAVAASAVLLVNAWRNEDASEIAALSVYVAGLVAMLGFSTSYNLVPPSPLKWLLRRFDHSAIYLMIAGTYTPLLLALHDRAWAWLLGILVWAGAAGGIIIKLFLPGRLDRVAVGFYLLLGWSGLLALEPISQSVPERTMHLILIGGALYTVGVIFHLWQSLKFQTAIWHGFVVLGAAAHFAGISYLVAVS
jgi:hemolysin III